MTVRLSVELPTADARSWIFAAWIQIPIRLCRRSDLADLWILRGQDGGKACG